jgi:formylmethanofuran dehydrogenase subunit E
MTRFETTLSICTTGLYRQEVINSIERVDFVTHLVQRELQRGGRFYKNALGMETMREDMPYEELVAFHGHSCPGLAIGFRMTKAALTFLSQTRAKDEELVAIVENDACGVDAVQYLSGCTFGKGNLVFRDYGKNVYTLYSRRTGKGVRVLFTRGRVSEKLLEDREQYRDWLLSTPESDIISLQEVRIEEPEPARIVESVQCDLCGEYVMVTRTREENGRTICIPCAERLEKS